MIKALFITHDISIYGASRSLQTLLRNYSIGDIQIDLMINRRLVGRNDIASVKKMFGPYINNIYQGYLPFEFSEGGKPVTGPGLFLKNLLYRLNRGALLRWIGRKNYHIVYLNSLVMHSLIVEKLPFLIHVREIFDLHYQSIFSSLRKARGIIFIDEATRKPFLKENYRHSIVLNNPFDMSFREQSSGERLGKLLEEKRSVISMIGKIKDTKGNLFVLRSFLKSSWKDKGVLIFVGDADDDKYLNQCKTESGTNSGVVYYGEEPDIEKIYQVSDFVIRGEAYPCIGRTIFEGLYSGCHVIIPGSPQDFQDVFEDHFKGFIHFYEPRKESSLSELLDRLEGTKVVERRYHSNATEYVKKFHLFLTRTINRAEV